MRYQRIISLVPSLTELLIDLGLKEQLIGRTRFCIHPADSVSGIKIIGGTKNPNIDKIRSLQPDLIITNKEENRKEDVEQLQTFSEVVITEIETIDQALQWITDLGKVLGAEETASGLVSSIEQALEEATEPEPVTTAYFIWKDPWMTIGNDTYIHDVMKRYGLINVFGQYERYPTTHLEELSEIKPDLILLSSEPYPFKQKHIDEIKESCPDSRIELINGEWFSWYGSRMLTAFRELNRWRS